MALLDQNDHRHLMRIGSWLQGNVIFDVDRVWPKENDAQRGLALVEEASKAGRAILKRDHVRQYGRLRKGMNEEQWTENLRQEIGQTMLVCLDIAANEGFSAMEALIEQVQRLSEMATPDDVVEPIRLPDSAPLGV